MKSFREISENTFYTTQSEKDKFTSNDRLVISAFIFSFVGMIGLLDGAKDNTKVKAYFRSDQKLRPDSITDANNDSSLIIKIMKDKGFFKKPTTANEITKFLVKVKSGQINEVDNDIVRGWLADIKDDKMKGLTAHVKREVNNFIEGGSLATLTDKLKTNARLTRWKDTEFSQTAKVVKIDPAKKKSAPSSPKPTTGTSDTDSTKASSRKVDPVTPTAPSPKASETKKGPLSPEELYQALRDGKDISGYPKAKQDINTSVSEIFLSNLNDLEIPQGRRIVDYLKKNKFAVSGLKNALVSKSYYGSSYRSSHKLEPALKMGILDLLTFSKNAARKVGSTISRMSPFDDWYSLDPSEYQKIRDDEIYQKLAQYALGQGSFTAISKSPLSFVANGDKEKSLGALSGAYGTNIVTKIGDNFVYEKTPDNAIYIDWAKFLGAKEKSPVKEMILELIKTGVWNSKFSSLSKDDIEEVISDIEISIVNNYSTPGNLISNSSTASEEWQKDLIRNAIDTLDLSSLFTFSYGRKDFNPEEVSKYPKFVHDHMEKLLVDNINTFKPESYERLIKYGEDINSAKIKDAVAKDYTRLVLNNISNWPEKRFSYSFNDPTGKGPKTETEIKNILNSQYKDLQNRIDSAGIDRVMKNEDSTKVISFPMNVYSDLSSENKKKIKDKFNSLKGNEFDYFELYIKLKGIMDKELFDILDPVLWTAGGGKLNSITSSKEAKGFIEKIFALPNSGDLIEEGLEKGDYERPRLISVMADSNNISEKDFSKYADKAISKVNDYYIGLYAESISRKESMTKKDQILFEKTMTWADENIGKLKKEYRELMTYAQPSFVKYANTNRSAADIYYQSVSKSMKKRLAAAYLNNGEFAITAGQALTAEKNPIKPFEKLTEKRIRDILKYNNVVSEETRISDKHTKTLDTLDNYLNNENKDSLKKLNDLQVEEVKKSPKELSQLTADYHRTKRSNRHGDNSMVIKKEFDVAIPLQAESQKEWILKDPEQEIINPMYHGTGSIAASMILRYGFRVIKSGDSSVVGRMLGDGVYGAIHLDKSQQYIGDEGYGRRIGTKGYIFAMNAALGEKGKDYQAAGLGNRDGIRSPEWCVFTPNSQFKIFKAYEVELVRGSTMAKILEENPPVISTNEGTRPIRFKSYIKEMNIVNETYPNYTTYTFVNGLIPTGEESYVDFEDFNPPKGVTLEPSAYGPTVVVEGTEESMDYLFTGPLDFRENNPEAFQEYLSRIEK